MTCCQYCKKIADEYGIKVGDVIRLIPKLGNKTNYVLHYKNLQLYLSLGMKLTKIHKMLKFKQSDWMKKHISFNTELKTNAANCFEKNFFKSMINSVYGNTRGNLRKRINVRLVKKEKYLLKYTSRPTHITHKIFDKNYAAIHEIEPVLTLNKPIFVGFTVLELSKWLMYDYHYSYIKKNFDAELLFTDTDSLTYEIKSGDVYEEFFKHNYLFDFNNFPKDSKFYDSQNKMVVGKMKVQCKEIPINKFVGLKSKMHSMLLDDGKESNTSKGIKTSFNKKTQNEKNSK